MKAIFFILLLVSSKAGAIEGTVWYDSKGKVAWVDGPAAEKKAAAPFIPQWVEREERRDRALRGDHRPRSNTSYDWPAWSYWGAVRPGYRPGSAVGCRSYPSSSFHYTRPSGGVRVIIR
jgi:hypothetical protein